MAPKVISVVVPCYNEEEALPKTAQILGDFLSILIIDGVVSAESKIIFVDDGSSDRTWPKIKNISQSSPNFSGIKLSANRGHQAALLAGMQSADSSDYVITIDADLQDDHQVIPNMIELANQGNDVVYGVRRDREVDSFFKKQTAALFYKLMSKLGTKVIHHHADFRLISKRVLKTLNEYKEVNLFLRGIFPLIGFRSAVCYYKRGERIAGISKYPLGKMISFALQGITSFSTKPLRIVTYLGLLTLAFTSCLSVWTLYEHLQGNTVQGWTSILISIYFIASVQLVCLGVIGEYIGKIYQESKGRPRYHIEETV